MSILKRVSFVVAFLCSTAGGLSAAELPAKTPHGILVDRVLPMARLIELDGSDESPTIGLARWRQTLFELQRSAENELDWPHPRNIAASNDQDVSLSLVHAFYDQMLPTGKTAKGEVFALAALNDVLYDGATVSFQLDQAHYFAHTSTALSSLSFDAGDGRGFRDLNWNTPIAVSYATTGRKTLTLRANSMEGQSLTAKTTIVVKRLLTPTPSDTLLITATEPHEGAVASGQAYLYLAPGHSTLTNPVVIVEGFDLDNSMDWPVLYDLLNQENMLEDLRSAGFDAVVLDFTEATEPIQRNAFVVAELLTQVNQATAPGRSTVLIGASMGGLVSRYALRWMENQAIDHQVRTFVSFDSPHLGANIPLGLQHWLEFFQNDSVDAAFLLSRLDKPAARQMLLHHYRSTVSANAQADPLHATWLADMFSLGDWPSTPRLVSLANGSGTAQGQGFGPGDQLISYEYRSLLVDIDGNVWAVPDQSNTSIIFDGEQNLIWPLPDTNETVFVANSFPWDSAPGGSRGSMAQMDATEAPYGDIIALHDDHCFVPTISALALGGVDPYFSVATAPDLASLTPFDQVYWPDANQPHIAVTAQNKVWLLAEIQDGVSAVPELALNELQAPQAAPNPFNPSTTISFRLARDRNAVALEIYDVAGRVVRRLITGQSFVAGEHSAVWQGRNDAGQSMPSGLYFARLQADGLNQTGRLMLLK